MSAAALSVSYQVAEFLKSQADRIHSESYSDEVNDKCCDLCSEVFTTGFFDGPAKGRFSESGHASFCISCASKDPLYSRIVLPVTTYTHLLPKKAGIQKFVCLVGFNYKTGRSTTYINLKALVEHFGTWDKVLEQLMQDAEHQERDSDDESGEDAEESGEDYS
jgi:hypothetical protein